MTTGSDWAAPASLDGEPDRGVVGNLIGDALPDPAVVSAEFRTAPGGHTAHFVETRRHRLAQPSRPGEIHVMEMR